MKEEAMTKQQRYYQKHKEEICQKRREKYHNNEEAKKKEKEYSAKWAKEHPYKRYLQLKRYRERRKAETLTKAEM